MISSRAKFPPKVYETKVQGSEFTPPVHNDLSICYPPSGACNLNKEEMQKRGNKNIDARKSLNELVLGNSASFGDEIVNIASVLTSPITAVARLAREHSSVSRAFLLTSSVFVAGFKQ